MLIQEIFSFLTFGFIIGLAVLSNYFLFRLDIKPLTIRDEVSKLSKMSINNSKAKLSYQESSSGQFIAERVYKNLKSLNDLGNHFDCKIDCQ